MINWRKGAEHRVEITGLSHEGSGVGRVEGRVVFVPDTMPGDVACVRLVDVKKRLAHGELKEILEASADRKEASCPHAKLCGGCQLQTMDYAAQLRLKRQQVKDALERIGKLDVNVLPTLGMENPYHYRNKAQIPFGKQENKLVMGFYQKGSHEIVDLETCEIQHPLLVKLALELKKLVTKLGIEPYDRQTEQGVLRHTVIRVSFSEQKLMLILVTRTSDFGQKKELIKELRQAVPELVSVVQNINPSVGNMILGRETKLLWGEDYLQDRIGELNYAISPGSFFQVNPKQTKVLYDLVKEGLSLTGRETILDLYCGAGTIGLYLASEARQVIGVESFATAVADARYNAERNGIKNATFHVGKAERLVPNLMQKEDDIEAVIVDPPRQGCDPALLETLVTSKVPKIVYVSCNPATLARDLSYLATNGYEIGEVQPVDMFPWTSHVETVTLLVR